MSSPINRTTAPVPVDFVAILSAMQDQIDDLTATVAAHQQRLDDLTATDPRIAGR